MMLDLPDSRNDDRDDGRKGVVGRDVGRRLLEPDLLALLSRGVVEEDMVLPLLLYYSGSCFAMEKPWELYAPGRVVTGPRKQK